MIVEKVIANFKGFYDGGKKAAEARGKDARVLAADLVWGRCSKQGMGRKRAPRVRWLS